jgi:tRNA G10  N-methylase Trm11
MFKYIFILGSFPAISLMEILTYLKTQKIEYKLIEKCNEYVVFSFEKEIDCKKIGTNLAGVVKIIKVLEEKTEKFDLENYWEEKINSIKEEYKERENSV